jgi:hypothetical protein
MGRRCWLLGRGEKWRLCLYLMVTKQQSRVEGELPKRKNQGEVENHHRMAEPQDDSSEGEQREASELWNVVFIGDLFFSSCIVPKIYKFAWRVSRYSLDIYSDLA